MKSVEKWVTAGAGVMDTATGLGLLFFPEPVMNLIGIEAASKETMLRLVGAFVFGVGSLYLLGWIRQVKRVDRPILSEVWMATAWIRACVGLAVLSLVMTRLLESAWLLVAATDLGLAAFQWSWLAKGSARKAYAQ